ncbi:hypothetical protein AVEN_247897-1 [Araneus ventricosus]|uniref:Uncharacterized protein n=1 Tax=Araneus ventricosus TaxID=182803 RepID=A0A4Y2W9G6_ARAVE|nr:hypothetical protein AVEN_247897-1 [Araneus ventricosus]
MWDLCLSPPDGAATLIMKRPRRKRIRGLTPIDPNGNFLLSRMRSIQRGSIVIVKKFELEILTNLRVLDLPESEKHNFGIMSVCEYDNWKTIRATGMKFGMCSLNIICRFLPNFGQNPSTGSLSVCMSEVM